MLKKNIQKNTFLEKIPENIVVSVPSNLFLRTISFFITKKKNNLSMNGFKHGTIPFDYVKKHYHGSLKNQLQHVFYHFYVLDILYKHLRSLGLYIPKIFTLDCESDFIHNKITYSYFYRNNLLQYIVLPDFKKLKFPERKKYRDLDKQAHSIIDQEAKNKLLPEINIISPGDWIAIKVFILDENNQIIDENLFAHLWINITNESIDREISDLFVGKKKGESCISDAAFLNDFLSTNFLKHTFLITIFEHVSHVYFSFDFFKEAFSYDNKDIFEKIIDIFSLRNDISLKKEKAQIALSFFLEKIKIFLEPDIVREHEIIIKNKIMQNPDYLLYQSDNNFDLNIKRLSCRQSIEKILIDHFISAFNISSSPALLYWYVNILQRNRLKEFLYFDVNHLYDNSNKFIPIHNAVLEQMALREKTVEFLIKKLS